MKLSSLLALGFLVAACGEVNQTFVDGAVDGADGLDATAGLDGPPPVDAAPPVDAPAVDAPAVDAPAVDAPPVDAPAVDAAIDAPAIDAAVTATLTVMLQGGGTGTVTATGISCGGDCTEAYPVDTVVQLTAAPATAPLAELSTFVGWSGACSGSATTCTVTMSAARTVQASFALEPNVAFVTTTSHTGNLGGLAGADAICQTRAQAGNLAGTFRAWLSTENVNASARLAGASGWVRRDGKPLAATVADLGAGRLRYPLRIDERGGDVGSVSAITGTTIGGVFQSSNTSCSEYTAAASASAVTGGLSSGGSAMFTVYVNPACSASNRLYCFGVDRAATLTVPVTAGRRAFVTASAWPVSGGLAGADGFCQQQATAAGLTGTFRALLATSSASALSRFDLDGAPWVRPDGLPILATAAAWSSASFFDVALALAADGTTFLGNNAVWTGASSLTATGTATCGNWTATTATGSYGIAGDTQVTRLFGTGGAIACTATYAHLYCLQQ